MMKTETEKTGFFASGAEGCAGPTAFCFP